MDRNLGNTCFISVSLNLLFANKLFVEYLRNGKRRKILGHVGKKLYVVFIHPKNKRSYEEFIFCCSRSGIVESKSRTNSRAKSYKSLYVAQDDPVCFIQSLLQKLESETPGCRLLNEMKWTVEDIHFCEKCRSEFVVNPKSERFYLAIDVNPCLGSDCLKCSLEKGLFLRNEKCSSHVCSGYQNPLTKGYNYVKVPEYAIIRVDHSDSSNKYNYKVDKEIVLHVNDENSDQRYRITMELVVVVVHCSSEKSEGHYICFTKKENKRFTDYKIWTKHDDMKKSNEKVVYNYRVDGILEGGRGYEKTPTLCNLLLYRTKCKKIEKKWNNCSQAHHPSVQKKRQGVQEFSFQKFSPGKGFVVDSNHKDQDYSTQRTVNRCIEEEEEEEEGERTRNTLESIVDEETKKLIDEGDNKRKKEEESAVRLRDIHKIFKVRKHNGSFECHIIPKKKKCQGTFCFGDPNGVWLYAPENLNKESFLKEAPIVQCANCGEVCYHCLKERFLCHRNNGRHAKFICECNGLEHL